MEIKFPQKLPDNVEYLQTFGIYGDIEKSDKIKEFFTNLGIPLLESFQIKSGYSYIIKDNNILVSEFAGDIFPLFYDIDNKKYYTTCITNIFNYDQLVYYLNSILPGDIVGIKFIEESFKFKVTGLVFNSKGGILGKINFKYILDNNDTVLWDFYDLIKN
jgi:hypothetical protein